ncbi:MAG: hypothetical protein MJ232_04520 [archaeon]|nr:hypothetical protein [archaeon]
MKTKYFGILSVLIVLMMTLSVVSAAAVNDNSVVKHTSDKKLKSIIHSDVQPFDQKYIVSSLRDAQSAKGLKDQTLKFKLVNNKTGKSYTKYIKTNKNGAAWFKVCNLKQGTYKVDIYFSGNSKYSGYHEDAGYCYIKSNYKITKLTKGAVKNHGYFYVKLTTKSGKVLANKIITMKSSVSGKTYKMKTNSKGVAKTDLWVKNKPLGKYYKYTFKYGGPNHNSCSSTFKVKIVK